MNEPFCAAWRASHVLLWKSGIKGIQEHLSVSVTIFGIWMDIFARAGWSEPHTLGVVAIVWNLPQLKKNKCKSKKVSDVTRKVISDRNIDTFLIVLHSKDPPPRTGMIGKQRSSWQKNDDIKGEIDRFMVLVKIINWWQKWGLDLRIEWNEFLLAVHIG